MHDAQDKLPEIPECTARTALCRLPSDPQLPTEGSSSLYGAIIVVAVQSPHAPMPLRSDRRA